jgi:hypothetical protein
MRVPRNRRAARVRAIWSGSMVRGGLLRGAHISSGVERGTILPRHEEVR